MPSSEAVVRSHYTSAQILCRIDAALAQAGINSVTVKADDLKPVDEFHIGGAAATRDLLAQVNLSPEMTILDVGSGIGGTARLIASNSGATVHGVDLTPDFVATADALSARLGLSSKTIFHVASATDLPFNAPVFDGAIMLHVGMNLPDKSTLMEEVFRVLAPGGWFAIYDIMKTADGAITYPVPWASSSDGSFLEPLETYRAAALSHGLKPIAERTRADFALEFFKAMRARMAAKGPPAVGLHLLTDDWPLKVTNMVAAIQAGIIAPTELIVSKPA